MAEQHHVVVDGSNLATEGRTSPSLRQLDEAVRAYTEEDPGAEVVVVVDASFEHRIDAEEREQLEQAELHGEVVSPPAGAIGRGDAFVLRIAERTGAKVLSNDSFQEFHGEHPWLFDDGRLIGGKPVPGVGWIFTPRIPVRGPKSRQATGRAKRDAARDTSLPAPVKAAELARAAKKVAARRAATMPDGSKPKVGDVWEPDAAAVAVPAAPAASAAPAEKSKKAKKAAKAAKATKASKTAEPAMAGAEAEAAEPAGAEAAGAVEAADVSETPAPAAKGSAKKTAKKTVKAARATKAVEKAQPAAKAAKTVKATKATKAAKKATAAKAAKATKAVEKARSARRPRVDPRVLEAIDEATAEALSPPPAEPKESRAKGGGKDGQSGGKGGKDGKSGGKGAKHRRPAMPLPAVNEPLAFITFVATYPLGSEVEGEVASFTSHGAMIEVELPEEGSLHCYIPLAGLGDPPPHKARQVLARGERRTFVLVSLDPPRRVAELALPEAVPQALAESWATA